MSNPQKQPCPHNDGVHPTCDYSLYLSLHDSVSDIVNWQKDDMWRKKDDKSESN